MEEVFKMLKGFHLQSLIARVDKGSLEISWEKGPPYLKDKSKIVMVILHKA